MGLQNSTWYIMLMVIFLILLLYTLWVKKTSKLIILYLSMSGLTYLFEYIVLVIFNSYIYNPNIMANEYFDNVMGAIVSDAFSIPITATFVAAFRLNYLSMVMVGGIILVIEILFTKLEIYKHYWWQYEYTAIGLVLAFWIAKKWYNQMIKENLNWFVQYITLFFTYVPIHSTLVFTLAGIYELYFYNVVWFSNPIRSHVAFSTLIIFLNGLIFVTLITFRLRIIWVIIGFLFLSILDYILLRIHILQLSEHWNLGLFLIVRVFLFLTIHFLNRLFLKTKQAY